MSVDSVGVTCIIRTYKDVDKDGVKVLLREAAFSHIWPGIKETASRRSCHIWTVSAVLATYAITLSSLYCAAVVGVVSLCICMAHITAAVYYVYGPPLADLNRIGEVYQSAASTQFWVAEVRCGDGSMKIAGTIAISHIPNKQVDSDAAVAYLRRMAVARKFRHRGIAGSLLKTAVTFSRLHRYNRIELITTDVHAAAMKLYLKYGFQCCSYRPRRYLYGLVFIWTYEFVYLLQTS